MSRSRVAPIGFQSSYTDSTGLIYLINRYYDPTTDQFLSVDPMVAQTDQPYAFVNDSPLNQGDPLGLRPAGPGLAAVLRRPPVKVKLKFSGVPTLTLSGSQTIDVPLLSGTITVTNTITVSGKNASSTSVDINPSTGQVTASNGSGSASFTPGAIANAAPSLGWGSITTQGMQVTKTSTAHVGGVTVADTVTATYLPNGWAPADGVIATGVVVVGGVAAVGTTVVRAIGNPCQYGFCP